MHDLRHNERQRRFELHVGDAVCELDYQLSGSTVVFTHTGTPPALRGQGLAAVIVQAGLQWARDQGLKVSHGCSYVEAYFDKHPQWADLRP
ncbi:GNAT family N-acetyltransferase [Inhella gelatinilytica]|uniref:N-acetyltransferase n=1 Tax=Inhella gelatinilytica TaxID=2795030 RepID=A0A931NG19_9BURK|nr:GNAT family N-acetyltransferase [Inhella gelatinilytica]MBH9554136.1 N-acetyltransferase [Inhella gelatinilytica]